MNNKNQTLIDACGSAASKLAKITESLEGWNLISELYSEPSEKPIRELCAEARSELENSAQMVLLGTFVQIIGKEAEYDLAQASITKSQARIEELSAICSELIKTRPEEEPVEVNPLNEIIQPVLEYMADQGIANISINQNRKGAE